MAQLQGVNRLELSKLRPGASVEDLRAAFGAKWKEPPRRWDGWIDGADARVGFRARVDVTGTIGCLSFYSNFPTKYTIEGLSLGMTESQVLKLRPALRSIKSGHESVSAYSETLEGGIIRSVSFFKGILGGMDLELPGLSYPRSDVWMAAPEGFYPKTLVERGAPFLDPGLKLVVLGALLYQKVIQLGTWDDLAMHVLGRYIKRGDKGDYLPEVHDYLLHYPLTKEHLAAVKRLSFDACCEIYDYIWPFWDGESDEFDVHSLEGIGYCPNIEEWYESSMIYVKDLRPLGALKKLRRIDLVSEYTSGTEVLCTLPELEEVRSWRGLDPLVVERLRENGVKVSVGAQ